MTSQGHHCTLSPPCRAGVLTAPLFAWVGAPPHSPEHPIMHTVCLGWGALTGAPHHAHCVPGLGHPTPLTGAPHHARCVPGGAPPHSLEHPTMHAVCPGWGTSPHSPEHPIMHTVAGRQRTPFLDPAELGAWVAGHDAVELHAGPYTLSLQLRRDLDCGCGSCWCGRGRERARGACGDRHEVVRVCVCM